jgi:hypothetical protein
MGIINAKFDGAFLISILLKHLIILAIFENFEVKTKKIFCKCVLKLNFATIKDLGEPSF